MKTKDLTEVIESEALSTADKVGKIMAMNGVDVNNAKQSSADDTQKLQDQIAALTKENQTLKDQAKEHEDYAELKKFKEDTIANAENEQKIGYLKGLGFSHPELLLDKVDFSKGTYDANKKTYTGLDDAVKSLKETYKDMYKDPTPKQNPGINPGSAGNSGSADIDGVTAAFMAMNPGIKI